MSKSHGMRKSPTYSIWSAMVQRCGNPNSKDYPWYGARGIAVCERWKTFQNFLEDMGERPAERSLDRINNDKGYEPGNCRWATGIEQMRNSRAAKPMTIDGRTRIIRDWLAEIELSASSYRGRISRGWDVERALTTPSDKRFDWQNKGDKRA